MKRDCIPCAYKIGCFDVALDKEFCSATPNQRPEQCPRSKIPNKTETNAGVLGFRRGMSILTVGDGDFSFSLGLARRLLKRRERSGKNKQKEEGKKTFLVATSYESESTLQKVYPDFDETLRELKELGVHVAYNVDATRILETLSLPDIGRTKSLEKRFHRICWNFPCTAIGKGQDGQNKAMEDNKELVQKFVQNARSVLTDRGDGELYVCHKTKPPFNQWNLEDVALQKQKLQKNDDVDGSITPPPLLYYSGRIVLDRLLLPPYTPRKALDKKSFPCHDACFFIFAQEHEDIPAAQRNELFLSTIPRDNLDLEDSDGGNEEGIAVPVEPNTAVDARSTSTTLIKIQPELIRIIRRKHMNVINPKKKKKRNGRYNKGGY